MLSLLLLPLVQCYCRRRCCLSTVVFVAVALGVAVVVVVALGAFVDGVALRASKQHKQPRATAALQVHAPKFWGN